LTEMKKVRTAVVGCGKISDIYLRNLLSLFSVPEVVCCCSKGMRSAREKAEKYGIAAMTFEEILQDDTIELAVNLTPSEAHSEVIRALLSAGKNVYTEKALATDPAQAAALASLAHDRGVRLGAAPDTFLGGGLQTVRWALDHGLIGEVSSADAYTARDSGSLYSEYPYTAMPGGGIAYDVGIYGLTALLSLFGPVSEAVGMAETRRMSRRYDDPAKENFGETYAVRNENIMTASLRFRNGVYGTLHFNGDTVFPDRSGIVICGTEGILRMSEPDSFGGTVRWLRKGAQETVNLPFTHGYLSESRGLGAAEMAWAIREERPHRASAEMAVHAVEVLDGIVRSSREKHFADLHSTFEIPEPLPPGYLDGYVTDRRETALS
jgi:predicted dehydrogenase